MRPFSRSTESMSPEMETATPRDLVSESIYLKIEDLKKIHTLYHPREYERRLGGNGAERNCRPL